jgi:branched-chain amino acid transport system permease protein
MSSAIGAALPTAPALPEPVEIVTGKSTGRLIAIGLLIVGYGIIPAIGTDYWFNAILIPFLIMSLAGLGLNLLTGYAGQASLGTGAFMAVGAYATYNLLLRLPELPLPLSLVVAGIIAGLAGVLFGLPSLRISGFYLTASTLAAQFLLPWLFNQYGWFSNYATSGAISAPRLTVLGHDLSSPLGRYLLTLTSVALLTLIAINLVRSQVGRNWMAIREMNTAAAVAGIPIAFNKLAAFAISSFVIGVAGALWAFAYLGTVDSRSFDLDRSFQALFIIIIGGMGSVVGSYIGAAFIILLPIFINHVAAALLSGAVDAGQLENAQKVLFGALIIFFLIKEPDGLAALLRKLRDRAAVWPLIG